MKKKVYGFIALLLVCCLCLCSCSSDANIMDEEYDDSIEDYLSEDIEETQEDEPAGVSMEQASKIGGVWIKRGEEYFEINKYELNYRAGSIYSYDYIGFSDSDIQEIPNLNILEGDMLVTFTNTEAYIFEEINSWNYCFPADVANSWGEGLHYNAVGIGTLNGSPMTEGRSLLLLTDNLEGYNLVGKNYDNNIGKALAVKNAYLVITDDNSIICADEPTSLEYEYYEGTKYCQGKIDVNAKVFFVDDKITEPVTKTKEGYFIVETDSLAEGFNIIDIGFGWPRKYVINIVK